MPSGAESGCVTLRRPGPGAGPARRLPSTWRRGGQRAARAGQRRGRASARRRWSAATVDARRAARSAGAPCADAERHPATGRGPRRCARCCPRSTRPRSPRCPPTDARRARAAAAGAGRRPDPPADPEPATPAAARLRLFDAVARFLERLAPAAPAGRRARRPAVGRRVLAAAARASSPAHRPVPLRRRRRLPARRARRRRRALLAELSRARGVTSSCTGWHAAEVRELVARPWPAPTAAERWAGEVHRRTGGHPFFVRQLAELLTDDRPAERRGPGRRPRPASPGGWRGCPTAAGPRRGGRGGRHRAAARRARRRVRRSTWRRSTGWSTRRAGRGPGRRSPTSAARLAHDLVRETVCARLPVAAAAGPAPAARRRARTPARPRRSRSCPADVARHFAAAVALDGPERAVHWARAAAAGRPRPARVRRGRRPLARARRAVEDAGDDRGRRRSWSTCSSTRPTPAPGPATRRAARELLADATAGPPRSGDAERLGRVALGVQRLGARFAMPRDEVVGVLETARRGGRTAADDRAGGRAHREPGPRAAPLGARRTGPGPRPLSERALALARDARRPGHAGRLPARPPRRAVDPGPGRRAGRGRPGDRALAERTGDAERHAEGLLLTANALLEHGSPAFRAGARPSTSTLVERFGQPRYDYLALTRRGALALIDGRLDDAERLIDEAAALGERIGEPDTGNVRMSQLLGLVRAPRRPRPAARHRRRGDPAGGSACPRTRTRSPPGSRAEPASRTTSTPRAARLDTVLALGTWRDDRSYLWSVFVGGHGHRRGRAWTTAPLCAELLAELRTASPTPAASTAPSSASWAATPTGPACSPPRWAAPEDARRWLGQALDGAPSAGGAGVGGRDASGAGRARRGRTACRAGRADWPRSWACRRAARLPAPRPSPSERRRPRRRAAPRR